MEATFRPTETMQQVAIYSMKKSLNVQKEAVMASLEQLQGSMQERAKNLVSQTINKGFSIDLMA